ncbi:MAG TPA: glycoside hydrolase family 130 protein [Acidobacteriaceae bacterium]
MALAAGAEAAHQNWQIGPFTRPATGNPVIAPNAASLFADPIRGSAVHWEVLHTFNPAAVVRNGKIDVLYRAEDNTGPMQIGMHTSRLGLALSDDGLHFTREAVPVFYPAKDSEQAREWPGGTEDPRIVEGPDGVYVITYTQWNRQTYRVGVATSRDLHTWTKHGPAFGMGKWGGLKYKSAGIVTECVTKVRCVAAKINQHYWMYWGEGEIHLATSDDLVHWDPVTGKKGEPKVLMRARPGKFDSGLPEVGPPPVVTKDGIALLYNGKNANGAEHDLGLAPGTYSVGQALFDAHDPARLLARTDTFFKPELPWEQSGQYAAGTTFAEGLVWFRDRWFLYYGCADSRVGVAMSPAAAGR